MAQKSPHPLILASASPRRRELLKHLGLTFDVRPADIDETPQPGEGADAYVLRLAVEKAAVVSRAHPGSWVLAADTTVVLENELLGKPADAAEAVSMLTRLAGRAHAVATGVALAGPARAAQVVRTEVRFRPLQRAEIEWYVRTGEPMDKAGSYGMQGVGAFMVESIAGSPTNVIGLPLGEVAQMLTSAGLSLPWQAAEEGR